MQQSPFSRRAFLAGTGVAALSSMAQGAPPASTAPNIVYIVCDQMRGDALGLLGNPNAYTPNLDALARRGVCCERWFSNNPVCAPSRATAFTGRYPHEHGKTTNKDGDLPDTLSGTMLGHFRDRGYRIGWVGKNHTYEKRVFRDIDTASIRNREPFRNYPPDVTPWWHSDMYWPEEECFGALNTRDAIRFLEDSAKDQPFFLHVSYFDPHPPYFAPASVAEEFGKRDMIIPPSVPPEKLSSRLADYARALNFDRMSDADLRQTMRYYHASIAWGVDQQVGAVVKALEDRGLMDNTILVFTSDHGDFMGHHGMVRKGMFHYDDLLHVPMIWYAPGHFEGGRRIHTPGAHVDLYPTLVDLSGGEMPKGLSGDSYAPALCGEVHNDADRAIYASATYGLLPEDYFEDESDATETDEEGERAMHRGVMKHTTEGSNRTAMIRTHDWKLIRNDTGGHELFDLSGTVGEQENEWDAPGNDDVKRDLMKRLEGFWSWG
jgi:arylsulfatase A-like enzyme